MQRGCIIDKGPRHGVAIHVMGFSVVAARLCLIGKLYVAFSFFSTLVFKKSHTVTIFRSFFNADNGIDWSLLVKCSKTDDVTIAGQTSLSCDLISRDANGWFASRDTQTGLCASEPRIPARAMDKEKRRNEPTNADSKNIKSNGIQILKHSMRLHRVDFRRYSAKTGFDWQVSIYNSILFIKRIRDLGECIINLWVPRFEEFMGGMLRLAASLNWINWRKDLMREDFSYLLAFISNVNELLSIFVRVLFSTRKRCQQWTSE